MTESLFAKAFRTAPLGSTGALLYGLDHAPVLTLAVLNGLAVGSLGTFAGSVLCRWCAIAAPTTRCQPPTAIARSWFVAMSTRW